MRKKLGPTTRGLRADARHPWRHENTGRLLLMSVINWQDILVRGLQQKGFKKFRASHMNLLRHIDVEGTRITEIAERARLSKQAIGQLVASCRTEHLVKVVSDPRDRRAKVVAFTELGQAVIQAERQVMVDMDEKLKRLLSARGLRELQHALGRLSEWK